MKALLKNKWEKLNDLKHELCNIRQVEKNRFDNERKRHEKIDVLIKTSIEELYDVITILDNEGGE